jgi:malate dehydrogenase
MKKVKVAVSGGAGQICYSLLFKVASGAVFGADTLIDLIILEVPHSMKALQGVIMELKDCAFPSLSSISYTDSPDVAFEGANYVFLVGARPRGKGMERGDLLKENGKIFALQGKALNQSKDAKVLVVGNPCNTNALILKHAANKIDPKNIRAMTKLDENRAVSMIAAKTSSMVSDVKDLVIFGNHSSTMVIDYLHASVAGKSVINAVNDIKWLQETLFPKVQKRGAEIIEARGFSSAASAANAATDAMRDWCGLTSKGLIVSAAVYSDQNPYGIDDDLYFSFPILDGTIVKGWEMDEFLSEKIVLTEKELIQERDLVKEFL